MVRDIDVANYFLSKDTGGLLFNKSVMHKNGRDFYEGNARLNKYLHIAQNLYIAKYQEKLFDEDLYAYDNGAVDPNVQTNYAYLLNGKREYSLPEQIMTFLDKIFVICENASIDELISISHEDPEWIKKHQFYSKPDQKMDSIGNREIYKEKYKNMIKMMDKMTI